MIRETTAVLAAVVATLGVPAATDAAPRRTPTCITAIAPSVVGQSLDTAEATLTRAGFRHVEVFNPTGGPIGGPVTAQSPSAGTRTPRCSTVTLRLHYSTPRP